MHRRNPFNTAALPVPSRISSSPLRRGFPVVLLVLGLFALSPTTRAQLSPPPDGGYPNANTAEGDFALFNLTEGFGNTAVGNAALYHNNQGSDNTGIGYGALYLNQGGSRNTATGSVALNSNSNGAYNTATGWAALNINTSGNLNTAVGAMALLENNGSNNTATGYSALENNIIGGNNTAIGNNALRDNNIGNSNTAIGATALQRNTGNKNTANGFSALLVNSSGNSNTATGSGALGHNTTGSFNVALGYNAGGNLTTGSDDIDIASGGVAGESNTMRIGTLKQTATYIAGIRGTTTSNGNALPVVIDSAGQLGTISSSQRFKDEIEPMDNASEAIMSLKPVRFHYKSDKQNTPQFGLIAEEVAKVNQNLVVRDGNGEIYTVRYEAVNAMLLNEFLKEHQKVEKLECTVAMQEKDFKATVAQQQKQIEALTATVQKVSDQMAFSKPAPQLVANN